MSLRNQQSHYLFFYNMDSQVCVFAVHIKEDHYKHSAPDLLLKLRVLELYQLVSLVHDRHKLLYQFHFSLSLLVCFLIVCRKGKNKIATFICRR